MKAKVFVSLIALFTACQEQTDNAVLINEPWTIVWQTNDHEAYGTIYLKGGHEAEVVIDQPDGFFFSQQEDVHFNWAVKNNQFVLTRLDNGFTMRYNIQTQKENYYQLSLEDDLFVKIYR